MKIFFRLLFVFMTTISVSQTKTYLELRSEYKAFCNEIVKDTITENGKIHFKIGNDLKLTPKDTIWDKVKCNEYKYYPNVFLTSAVQGYSLLSSYGTSSYYVSDRIIETRNGEFTVDISRIKVCDCKRQEEYEADFWKWVDEKYLKNN